MKALVYSDWSVVELQEVEKPECKDNEVLIGVEACGICGSEIECFRTKSPRRQPSLILGHEFCGYVKSVPNGNSPFKKNQKIVVNSVIPCGTCALCLRGDTHLCIQREVFGMNRPGGAAEFVAVPYDFIYPRPDNLDPSTASLTEPLAVGIHMLKQLPLKEKQKIVIFGAGAIGILMMQAARALYSAEVLVVDLNEKRLREVEKYGSVVTINSSNSDVASACIDFSGPDGVDVCIDAVGVAETKVTSLKIIRPGGTVGWFGLGHDVQTLSSYDLILKEKKIFGSYGGNKKDFLDAINLLSSGQVKGGDWLKVFPMGEAVEAFNGMMKGDDNFIKAVVMPQEKL